MAGKHGHGGLALPETLAAVDHKAIDGRKLPWTRADWLALGTFAALCVLFFWPLVTPFASQLQYVVAGDFTNQFYPYHYFAGREWWSGRIPLWNPYMFGGHPFQADIQTAVFYPLGLLTNLIFGRGGLPFRALELQGVADYFLAGLFTYLFLRLVTSDRVAALLGAVVFALGGYLTSYPQQQMAVLETSVWLPLVLLLIEIGARRRRILWWLAAGLAIAVAILGGHPQSALFIVYVAVAFAIWRCRCLLFPWRRVAAVILALGSVAAGAAAVQLLPAIELTALSTRAAISYEVAATGYDYVALPGLLMPAWRGEHALYLGVPPILLAIVAIWRWRRGPVWFWTVVALVALALSFGDHGVLYRLFHLLAPGFATFKGQERSAFVFSFAGAVLAAYGLTALRQGLAPLGFSTLVKPIVLLAGAGAAGIILFWNGNDVVSGGVDLVKIGYPRFLLSLVLAGGLLFVLQVNKTARAILISSLALVALASADVLSANWGSNLSPLNPAPSPQQLAAVEFLKAQESREGEPLRVRPQNDQALGANYGGVARLPLASGDSPIVVQRTQDFFGSPEEWRLWQLLNVKYVVSFGQPTEALQEVFASPPLKVYRNLFSLPRAWVVEDVAVIPDPRAAKEAVLAREFVPGSTAVVERALNVSVRPAVEGELEEKLDQHIEFSYYSPRRLFLRTSTNRPGLLVLSEINYPGWQAKLDGVPVPILATDYILRGVELPAGDHQLEMVYNPTSFWVGLGLSVVTLLVIGGFALTARRKKVGEKTR